MKGRNTSVLSVRVSDVTYSRMKIQAGDMSVGEFFKHFIQSWFGYKHASIINIRINEKAYEQLVIQANLDGNIAPGEYLERFVNGWFENSMWEDWIYSPMYNKTEKSELSPWAAKLNERSKASRA